MEETVETPAPANVFAFGPEESAPVDEGQAADPVGEEVQETDGQTAEAEESAEGVSAQFTDQEQVNRAIGLEKHRIREQARQEYERKLADDPVRQLGQLMMDDLVTNKGLSQQDAIKEATDNLLKAIAKRDGVSVGVARKLYGKEVKQEVQEAQSDIEKIAAEVMAAPKPKGFDAQTAYQDKAFLDLLQQYPAEAAIRIYAAENRANNAGQDLSEKLRTRQSIPQSTRPQQSVKPVTDWTQVSTDDFMAEKARRQKLR